MAHPAAKPATYADIVALPENLVGEIIAGELIVSPRPANPHARVASILGMDLGGPFDRGRNGPGGWWILDEPELHLAADVLVPDLAGWRRERLPVIPRAPYFEIAPNWVCEILSPSTAGVDRVKKMPTYARAQVDHIWLIDPDQRTLEVFSRKEGYWLLTQTFSDNDVAAAAPFEAVPLNLDALWL